MLFGFWELRQIHPVDRQPWTLSKHFVSCEFLELGLVTHLSGFSFFCEASPRPTLQDLVRELTKGLTSVLPGLQEDLTIASWDIFASVTSSESPEKETHPGPHLQGV